jgi:hypothetical protein
MATKAVVQIGWDDVPWLPDKIKKEFLAATPPHEREARSRGIPVLGDGNVFQTPLEDILIEPQPIPAYWKRLYGIDVGDNTAVIALAHNPEDDVIVVYSDYCPKNAVPERIAPHIWGLNKAAGFKLPGLMDPSARNRSLTDGRRVIEMYRGLDCTIVPANNNVTSGIFEMRHRLETGRLKVFKTCVGWQNEYMTYHYKDGKIVKTNDHRMDATRYGVMGIRYAKTRDFNGNTGGFSGRKYF